MKIMPFPDEYKEALRSEKKNMTIRVGEEMSKYRVGETYRAGSYDGDDWGIEVVIQKMKQAVLDDLSDLGVPEKEIKRVKSETDRKQVEVIWFEMKD